MTDDERRHYQRIPFIADVLLQHQNQQSSCGLEDISLKGMLIKAPENIQPETGEIYAIELVLGEGAVINMQANISHTTPTHWGMQWSNIDLEGLTHLRRLLELNMDDAQQMHREMADLG